MDNITNPNEPANPCTLVVTDKQYPQFENKVDYAGFTKREVIAKDFMAALLNARPDSDHREVAKFAVNATSELIKALNEKES